MSENYKVIDSTVPTFITITVVDWVDLFVRHNYCTIIDEPTSARLSTFSGARLQRVPT
ncbi:hypothetical protein SAMN04488062_11743 [Flavobacterium omnivorum]|uniref:Uncharacterized protein n=1 Tax=Flavobacterium omnivorum TaxID=178355 RepID=A0A1G8G7H5_9FLAO|nr:hypothetical protein [Flavobacterium omnivorum]SDH90303.1 hypothetical protein SAMN04488062_11743 [Flavobacterium omnivorum]